METLKTALQAHHYMCNNFASTKRPLNFVHFSGNEPRMGKSAQNWRNCPHGNAKFSIPDKITQFTPHLLDVSVPVPQKCPADLCHKNQSLKRYSRFSCKFLIFWRFWTRFSRISPHAQKSRKSDLLQNLIIYRYGAACKFLGKSYGKFLRYPIFGGYFVYVFSGAAPGPSPSLKVDLLREKANSHLALEAELTLGPLARCIFGRFSIYFYTNVYNWLSSDDWKTGRNVHSHSLYLVQTRSQWTNQHLRCSLQPTGLPKGRFLLSG